MRVVERKRKRSMSNGVSLRTPSYTDMDLRFTLGERWRVQAFAQAFNRTNVSQVATLFTPNAQGQFSLPQQKNGRFVAPRDNYRAAFAPRQLQFGFRLTF